MVFCGLISKLIYPVNAFAIVQLVLCFCSATVITRVFLDKFKYITAVIATLFINGFYAVNYYSVISFTMAPAIICTAGFLCILHYINREKWIAGTLAGFILVIFGSICRFSVFEVVLVIFCVFYFTRLLCEYFREKKENRSIGDFLKNLFQIKRLITLMLILVVSFGLNFVSSLIDSSTEELRYYKEYTSARAQVWDYDIPTYEEAKADYDKAGISENDLKMINGANGEEYFDDQGNFPLEKINELIKIKKENKNTSLVTCFKNMIIGEIAGIRMLSDKGVAAIGFGIIFIAFLLCMKKRNYFVPFALALMCLLIYSYLWIQGRILFRTVYMLWVSCSVYLIYSFSYEECREWIKNKCKRKKLFLSLASILFILFSCMGLFFSEKSNYWKNAYSTDTSYPNSTYEYILNNTDKKFIESKSSTITEGNSKAPFIMEKTDFEKNYMSYYGAYYNSSWDIDRRKAFGYDNLYSALLEDDVYFVDGKENPHVEHFKEYLQEYYAKGKTVDYKIVKQIDNNNIIKFEVK